MNALIGVTGRFQPFHFDHLDLVRYALARADRVLIGITNPDATARVAHAASAHRHLPESNPWTFAERATLVLEALRADGVAAERFCIVPFDLEDPAGWRSILPPGTPQLVRVFSEWEREKARRFADHGYPPLVLEGNPAVRISASDIRAAMRSGGDWAGLVPPGARDLLLQWAGAIA